MFYYKNLEFKTNDVYEPAEDSILLANVIEKLNLNNKDLLDMGCGSGIQSIIAATKGANVVSVDINPKAIEITKENSEINEISLTVIHSNLFKNVDGKFDFIVFNSPYLPTEDDLPQKETWSGGENLEILVDFLKQSKNHLKEKGIILLLISSITGLDFIKEKAKILGYDTSIVSTEKIPWETLYVLELKTE